MTKLVEKELAKPASIMEKGKLVDKKPGDIVSVSQGMIDDNPGLFADLGDLARKAKVNTKDNDKLKARVAEVEAQNKALVSENKALKSQIIKLKAGK